MFWQTLYQTVGDFIESANITNALDSAKFVSFKKTTHYRILEEFITTKGIVFPITTRSFSTHCLGILEKWFPLQGERSHSLYVCRLIGASLSEPHTREFNADSVCVCLCVSYV